MSMSPILGIAEMTPDQNNKYLTHNNAVALLEAASNDILAVTTVGSGPVTVTEADATQHFVFNYSGASAAFDVVFPSTINSANTKRVMVVQNLDATYAATVKASTGTGLTVSILPGGSALLVQDFEDFYALTNNATTPSDVPYDIGVFIPGLPDDAGIVVKYVFDRDVDFVDDFVGSYGHVEVNPTSTSVFTVFKNGSSIGTISISTGGVFTFTTTGGATSFAAGDRIKVTAPTPQDLTLSDVSITFAGTRSP